MILLTPVGLIATGYVFFIKNREESDALQNRKWLFMQIFTGIPFLVFLLFSLFDHPKFHWNGPVWLAILPAIAWMISTDRPGKFTHWLQKAWRPTLITCLFGYAFTLHYLVLGIPGISYQFFTQHFFWRETTVVVNQVAKEVRQKTGLEPIIVGMSKWSVASSLHFYNHAAGNLDIRSRNLFGDTGAMYDYWYPSPPPANRPIIQIAMKPNHLDHIREGDNLKSMLREPGDIESQTIFRDETPLRRVYYRVSEGFNGNANIFP